MPDAVDGLVIPTAWQRLGLMLPRNETGFATMIVGDPCIVFDDEISAYRMFIFGLPPGNGEALCLGDDPLLPGAWEYQGPLTFTNPEALLGEGAFKPWVVMDPRRPNRAARVAGRYMLLFLTNFQRRFAQRAYAETLAGPWEIEPTPLISTGAPGEFDERHVEAITGYYFPERDEVMYFYMGFPKSPQREISPFGSAQCVAVEHLAEGRIEKLGPIIEPVQSAGHWASGWLGGLQLLPGRDTPWIAVLNASPTPPDPGGGLINSEEPPPSLGGFATCANAWPIDGWSVEAEPVEWVEAIPPEAEADGERDNLWRHHVLMTGDGRVGLFYNTGTYGAEQIYAKVAADG